ncbi:hypothetical protein MKI84_12935 [Ancylobacter sp. A5.8]|uniref:hypothetical protein n=1 Tax=Ancylobacter gelatini TaxID=2919920 RepID=UPI001F4E7FF0|nr:hypothetical protein [Ancylobacter gelatini]MCJ8143822.1 hypothetical protein [Ancylobacter gelatini]
MTVLRSPASLMDIAACAGNCSAFKWSALRVQFETADTWALRADDGSSIAVGGIQRDGGAWFIAAPVAARHLPAIVRAIRATVPPGIRVDIRTPEGARLARLAGFRPQADGIWRFG